MYIIATYIIIAKFNHPSLILHLRVLLHYQMSYEQDTAHGSHTENLAAIVRSISILIKSFGAVSDQTVVVGRIIYKHSHCVSVCMCLCLSVRLSCPFSIRLTALAYDSKSMTRFGILVNMVLDVHRNHKAH